MTKQNSRDEVVVGIFLLLGGHVAYGIITSILVSIPFVNRLLYRIIYAETIPALNEPHSTVNFWAHSIIVIGVAQSIYALPLHRYFWKRNQLNIAKGIAIAATLTFLINGICFTGV